MKDIKSGHRGPLPGVAELLLVALAMFGILFISGLYGLYSTCIRVGGYHVLQLNGCNTAAIQLLFGSAAITVVFISAVEIITEIKDYE